MIRSGWFSERRVSKFSHVALVYSQGFLRKGIVKNDSNAWPATTNFNMRTYLFTAKICRPEMPIVNRRFVAILWSIGRCTIAKITSRVTTHTIYEHPENFRESLTMPTATFLEIFNGLLFQSILWMWLQNLKFVALPVCEITGGTQKICSPWIHYAPFSPKFSMGFCLDVNVLAKFDVHSFISSWDNSDWSFGWALRTSSLGKAGRTGLVMVLSRSSAVRIVFFHSESNRILGYYSKFQIESNIFAVFKSRDVKFVFS